MGLSDPNMDVECRWVRELLGGDVTALAELRRRHEAWLISLLIHRGATPTEAHDLSADLWGDCVPGDDDRPSLLEKYHQKCSLKSWLATVATRRLVDLKRRQKFQAEMPRPADDRDGPTFFEKVPVRLPAAGEPALVALLRQSLEQSFALCPAQALVSLRLVYLHGVTQRELGRLWGWHEAKVSRTLSQAMGDIQTQTLAALKQRDAWLELNWEDFVELCETEQFCLSQ